MGCKPVESHGDLAPQYILAGIVNVVSFSYGTMIGWLAPMQPLLMMTNYNNTNGTSPFGEGAEPMLEEAISWIGGFFCIGGIIGGPIYGYLADSFGRKKTLILSVIPFIASFGLFLAASSAYFIYVSRFIAGIAGGGVCVIVPMYVGETVEPVARGILGSFFNLFICLGILTSFIVGSYTSYNFLSIFAIVIPVVFLAASLWLPESPIYSIVNNRMDEASNALWKLRGNHRDLIEQELTTLTSSVKEMSSNDKETMSLAQMLRDTATRKGLIIGTVLMAVMQFSGIAPILNYTVEIFRASGSDLSPHLCTIIVGSLQIVGASSGTVLMERAGRKILLLVSAVGMAFSLGPIAVFFHLKETHPSDDPFVASLGWIPVSSLAAYIVVYALGFGAVPFVLVSEMFKAEARSKATSICVIVVWGYSFFLLKFYSNFEDWLGTSRCFGLFSVCSMLGAVFTWFYIPETKGKTLEMILYSLGGREEVHPMGRSSPIPLVVSDEKVQEGNTYSNGTSDRMIRSL